MSSDDSEHSLAATVRQDRVKELGKRRHLSMTTNEGRSEDGRSEERVWSKQRTGGRVRLGTNLPDASSSSAESGDEGERPFACVTGDDGASTKAAAVGVSFSPSAPRVPVAHRDSGLNADASDEEMSADEGTFAPSSMHVHLHTPCTTRPSQGRSASHATGSQRPGCCIYC